MAEPVIRFYGRIVKGEKKYLRPELYKKLIVSLEGKEFEETLQERFVKESNDQHGYYRGGIIKATCMQTEVFAGLDEEEIHEYFADKFLSFKKHITIGSEEKDITVIESTGNLGKKRMSEFIEKVLNHLAELEIYPLTPEEYKNNKYQSYVKAMRNS